VELVAMAIANTEASQEKKKRICCRKVIVVSAAKVLNSGA
jgi:hypothetical protein